MAILKSSRFYMYSSGRVVTAPLLSDFDGLPYPPGKGYMMFFFLANDLHKGWSNDYLDPLLSEFWCCIVVPVGKFAVILRLGHGFV